MKIKMLWGRRFWAMAGVGAVGLGIGAAMIGGEPQPRPAAQAQHVATFADWPKTRVGDLPPGAMFTQDGNDLLQKLNAEFQVPALFTPEGGVVGNGTAERIADLGRIVGVVRREGVQVWRKEGEEPVR